MKASAFVVLLAAFLAAPVVAQAEMFTFTPSPADLYDLDHSKAYLWAINWTPPPGQTVIGAELFFDDIRNWDNNPNVLYVELLNSPPPGIHQYTDNEGGGDYFLNYAGGATHLVTYTNLPTTPQDLTYVFTPAEVVALNSYLADGRFGIGLDPDCHFYNKCIKLKLVTPEPASVVMLLGGAMAMIRRRRTA
jgi:hypothetical protein